LIDPDTGSCSNGLHPDRPNENKGAESVLSYLLGLVEIRQLKRAAAKVRTKPLSKLVRSDALAIAPQTASGGLFVPIPIPAPADLIPSSGSGQSRRSTV
jgi:hypothetical protein